MHLEDQTGLVPDRRAVVADPGPVRGADLGEPSSGRREDVGDPELPTDLDQLAARDEDLFPLGEGGHRQQECRGAIVDHHGRVRARERGEKCLGVAAALAATPGLPVHLDVGVGAGGARRCPSRALGQRRAPEVRVQDDTGGIDHRHHPLRRMGGAPERPGQEDLFRRGILAHRRSRSHFREHLFERPLQERPPERLRGPPRGIGTQERIHRGNFPAEVDGHGSGSLSPRSRSSVDRHGLAAAPLG